MSETSDKKPAGRPKGSKGKVALQLKEAILRAAELTGDTDAKGKYCGKEGLVGYLRSLARSEPAVFGGLLGKVLPLTIAGDKENPLVIEERRKMFLVLAAQLEARHNDEEPDAEPKVIEHDPKKIEH